MVLDCGPDPPNPHAPDHLIPSTDRSPAAMISTSSVERIAGLALLSLLAVGSLVVLRPFMSALLWAVILTFSTWPIYAWLLRTLGDRVRLAAAIMTLAVAAVLVAPLAVLGAALADHVASVAAIARAL